LASASPSRQRDANPRSRNSIISGR
jgi:hypothetical protein